ncbi:MAG: bifunctional phosphoglucose/phosphomannose isomerase [Saprospiraceae bacterium]|nr:bifunctional phosphoglucose/phosphomannose isomerase [Saprospiraceae bacterium]
MMDELIARFPDQLEEALAIGANAKLAAPDRIDQVFVTGLGGSGIGGDFVSSFVRHTCPVPYIVGKSYQIPKWVGPHTLAIASSYSGNTEETLIAMSELLQTGAKVIVISSGGQLIQLAKDKGLDFIQLPDNWPSPRACLGYSLVQQLSILERFGLIDRTPLDQIGYAAKTLRQEMGDIRDRAERIAALLHGKTTVIYTTDRMEPVALRFRQQLNENAKVLCWHHVIPEMNHNELVGWRDRRDDLAVLVFRNHDDYNRNQMRLDINKEIISHYTGSFIEVYSKGQSLVEQTMYQVHLGDWISWYLAQLRGVDAMEVRVIDFLKSELADR